MSVITVHRLVDDARRVTVQQGGVTADLGRVHNDADLEGALRSLAGCELWGLAFVVGAPVDGAENDLVDGTCRSRHALSAHAALTDKPLRSADHRDSAVLVGCLAEVGTEDSTAGLAARPLRRTRSGSPGRGRDGRRGTSCADLPGKRVQLEQRRITQDLRDDEQDGAPEKTGIDLDAGTARIDRHGRSA
ncbi:DUF6191 domain-containing protein [Streptomyces sp. NPDC054863]